MLARERVLMALNHEEPDRVPIDLGSTPVSGICRNAYAELLAQMGLSAREIQIIDVLQQLAGIDEDVLEALGVDFRGIASHTPAGFQLEIVDEGGYEALYDEWGAKLRRPKLAGPYLDRVEDPTRE